jgi:hypothetical protein
MKPNGQKSVLRAVEAWEAFRAGRDLTKQTGNQAAYKAITADVIGLIINHHYANRPLLDRNFH